MNNHKNKILHTKFKFVPLTETKHLSNVKSVFLTLYIRLQIKTDCKNVPDFTFKSIKIETFPNNLMISFNLGLYWIVAELWFITRKHYIQQSYAGSSFYYNSKLILWMHTRQQLIFMITITAQELHV